MAVNISATTILVVCTIAWILWETAVYINSPLRKIPNGHWSAPISRLWLKWARARGYETSFCHAAHQRLGPVIRIGPREISINCIEGGVQTVYGGNWDKAEVYANFVNYGHPPMFALLQGKAHGERRRLFSQPYAKSTINNSSALKDILSSIGENLRDKIQEYASSKETVNAFPMAEAYSMDVATSYIYGTDNSTKWISDDVQASKYLPAFLLTLGQWPFYVFTELAHLVEPLSRIGISLLPANIMSSHETITTFSLDLTNHAVEDLDTEKSSSPAALRSFLGRLRDSKYPLEHKHAILASDLLDQVHAAHQATGIVLTFAMYEISRHPEVQTSLRSEIKSLISTNQSPFQSAILENVLTETMRLYPAAFGPFPRCAPSGAKVCGFDLPCGTIVSASPYTLGRNREIFGDDAEQWVPARWNGMDEQQKKNMKKWVWIFTSGSRACIGEHLAVLSMKSFLIDIYGHFTTVITKESNMRQAETFISTPVGEALWLEFQRA